MITAHVPTLAWAPPSAFLTGAMLIEPANLTIPHNFPTWVPPPPGVDPCWWPINPAQQAALSSRAEMLLFGGQSGGGKRLSLDTPLATPSGLDHNGDVRVGDILFDDAGHATRITGNSSVVNR